MSNESVRRLTRETSRQHCVQLFDALYSGFDFDMEVLTDLPRFNERVLQSKRALWRCGPPARSPGPSWRPFWANRSPKERLHLTLYHLSVIGAVFSTDDLYSLLGYDATDSSIIDAAFSPGPDISVTFVSVLMEALSNFIV